MYRDHTKLNISELTGRPTSHNSGTKKVITTNPSGPVMIKQIAVGILQPGETIEEHRHPDLDEHYFVLSGSGSMQVEERIYELKKGDFILVTAGSLHRIYDITQTLEFYYQGFELVSEKPF